jgi:hypothetical protein
MSRAKKKSTNLPPLFVGKRDRVQARKILAMLGHCPSFSNAVIDRYCTTAGPPPRTAQGLADALARVKRKMLGSNS